MKKIISLFLSFVLCSTLILPNVTAANGDPVSNFSISPLTVSQKNTTTDNTPVNKTESPNLPISEFKIQSRENSDNNKSIITAAITQSLFDTPLDDQNASVLGIDDKTLQNLTADIFAAAKNYENEVNIEKYNIPYSNDTGNILAQIAYKGTGDPKICHIKSVSLNAYQDGAICKLIFTYSYTKTEYEAYISKCRTVADSMISDLKTSDLTDLQKALIVHDRLAVMCEYDSASINATEANDSHKIIGVFCNKKAVCEGYAKAYIYLLDKLGIESYMCSSNALNHAWNIVKINNKYYHTDVTWDDPVEDITGRVNHNYFMVSDQYIKENGHNSTDYTVPETDNAYDNAFWMNSNTEFVYLKGTVYYIDSTTGTLCSVNKNQSITALYKIPDTWYVSANSFYPKSFSRLSGNSEKLYYSGCKNIYSFDPVTGKSETVYFSNAITPKNIYGFTVMGDYFLIDITDSPNYTENTKKNCTISYCYKQIIGDINGDGDVNAADRTILARYLAKWQSYTDDTIILAAADINGDGEVTSADRTALARYLAKWQGYETLPIK